MLNYVSIEVSDLERTASFYDAVLRPLGWRQHFKGDGVIGWGITRSVFQVFGPGMPRPGFGCVSFPAKSIPAVKAAWEAGLAEGAESQAQPGGSPLHGPGNYAARLSDPDGYTVEIAVSHG